MARNSDSNNTSFLTQNSVPQNYEDMSDKDKPAFIGKSLLERYKEKNALPDDVAQIKSENLDLRLSNIEDLIKNIKGVSAEEYFTTLGILKTSKMKLEEIVNVLKERYIGTNQKAYLFSELKEQNPDLPFSELPNLIKEVHNQSPRGYLTSIGILSEYGEAAETAEKFKDNLSFEEMYNIYLEEYKKQTVDNPYFDITIPKKPRTRKLFS